MCPLKKILRSLVLIILLSFPVKAATVSFLADTSNFTNPERGFAPDIDPPWPTQITWGFQDCVKYNWTAWTSALDETTLRSWRSQGYSLVMIRYHIAEFRSSALSSSFISRLNADFATARKTGMKLIPRFVYNWPLGGPDAPLNVVLMHIGQLKDILRNNADVLSTLEYGLIGSWGECGSTCYDLLKGPTVNLIADSLLSALPSDRMLSVRYPRFKFRYFGGNYTVPSPPLTEAEAFSRTKKARWAEHDDCPVCGEYNCGTWGYDGAASATAIRDFLASDNQYVAQGGEPGDPDASGCPAAGTDADGDSYAEPHGACTRILWMFETMHWSHISASYGGNFNNAAYARWKSEGCYGTIAKRLGYRYRMIQASAQDSLRPGTTFNLSLNLTNEGFASAYNPRKIEIVLRNTANSEKYLLEVIGDDTIRYNRTYLPKPGEIKIWTITAGIPTSMPVGTYDVLLNLPDPYPSIHDRPEYSIRLANTGVWETSTGYNKLNLKLKISTSATGTNYTGKSWFGKPGGVIPFGLRNLKSIQNLRILINSRMLCAYISSPGKKKVIITDLQGRRLVKGFTDEKGKFETPMNFLTPGLNIIQVSGGIRGLTDKFVYLP